MGDSINVCINGEKKKIAGGSSLSDVLSISNVKEPFAVAVNNVLVTKVDYVLCALSDGDTIDIVHPMQGG